MTSFMSDVIKKIEKIFNDIEIVEIDSREIKINVKPESIVSILSMLKGEGYSHLSLLTAVDWIEENKFELVYILFSWKDGSKIIVSTKIERGNSQFVTVKHLWSIARYYEREIHEFFGINFEGNDDMKPLFLENWDDIPPLRKDFDPMEYSRKKFPDREYKKDVIHEAKIIRGDLNG
ncbi:NADH dehydrogenase [Thermosipho melanesiensis]|uniref:NADH dehydrogenase (Ubiquinone), 30 kDa subunit n=2 Tax=Thermosipho melanesiensis TaxID=46541 RepID=A6LMC3_THEM4|nr:NADH-quinone oxidoreductase subunit C [Thermosipho melanesiensis]ABR31074.1 NADH dehydrogenase (ubiquinone), 30 kDa subunit [Thermosipho melanesiensis BI429]APT74168.1 NADH dehydrogenase [Thermosipho melanesiensis]OOC36113.1 NADH dehydrogenase [Thermosipho melanesiensis]OOC36930.1 NADH dehydrogenase [Thermosipho melanesiensis]OOC37681.1 NADH dehydrogenase [Thermosipho melanesiensis]